MGTSTIMHMHHFNNSSTARQTLLNIFYVPRSLQKQESFIHEQKRTHENVHKQTTSLRDLADL
uniref:Uncharacterized protein n=1 Tax=Arundo donax TaxID=35708 RepID=A0A0A8Z2K7_ARUDO